MTSRVKCKYGGSGCGGGESVPGGISSNKIEQTKPNELHRTKAKQSKTKSKSTTIAHVHVCTPCVYCGYSESNWLM